MACTNSPTMKFASFPGNILSQYEVQAISVGVALQGPEGLGFTGFTTTRSTSNL
jgi:hypothetical protein